VIRHGFGLVHQPRPRLLRVAGAWVDSRAWLRVISSLRALLLGILVDQLDAVDDTALVPEVLKLPAVVIVHAVLQLPVVTLVLLEVSATLLLDGLVRRPAAPAHVEAAVACGRAATGCNRHPSAQQVALPTQVGTPAGRSGSAS